MKIRFASLALIVSAVCSLSSCLSSDDDTEYTYAKETGISAFTLGTMNRYLHTTSSEGADSVYKVTYTGSSYKMTIDQLGGRIYNNDSLPYGTDLEHVLATITAVDNGTILLKSATSDSLSYYSSTDSIDFSVPRTVRIAAQDGQRYTDYIVTLTARTAPENTMAWQEKTTDTNIAALDDIKAIAAGRYVYVFGNEGGTAVAYRTAVNDGTTWTRLSAAPASISDIVVKDSSLYALNNGTILRSADGESWTPTGSACNLLKLVAASSAHLYAITTADGATPDGMASSADDGATWTSEAIDDNAALLPLSLTGYTSIPLKTNDSIEQVMITGFCPSVNDVIARSWTKLDDYSSYPVATSWSYVGFNTDYKMEGLASLSITSYAGAAYALGNNGSTVTALLRSLDGGITWKDSELDLPEGLSTITGKLAMTADTEGSLWIISDGTVWKN